MIEFKCDEGTCEFGIKGDICEISADMCIFVRKVREVVAEQSDKETIGIFDRFLKEHFIDMALGDPEKMFIDAIVETVADRVAEKMKKKEKDGEE